MTPELEAVLRESPPLSPGAEGAVVDAELEVAGRARVQDAKFLRTAVTRNDVFGNVFRADFHFSWRNPEFALRLVCWRKDNGEYRSLVCPMSDIGAPLSPLAAQADAK